MPEGDLAGEAEEDVDPDPHHRGEPDERDDVHLVAVGGDDGGRDEYRGNEDGEPPRELHTFFTSARPKSPCGARGERDDDERERHDVGVRRAEERGDEGLGEPVDESRQHDPPGIGDAAEDRHRERLDPEEGSHRRGDDEEGSDEDPRDPGEEAGEGEGEDHRRGHVDAHEPRRVRVLDHREEGAAVPGAVGEPVQGDRDRDPRDRDHHLEGLHLDVREVEGLGGERGGGHPARDPCRR